jgi:lipase chaperone LimK
LKQIQQFRRDRLGVELADKLFGADVKAKEYAFRRADIVGDKLLYGEAKEDMLKQLNEDMWGEDADAVEKHPNDYNRYKEKLLIYKKDMDEIDSDELRQKKIKEFRNEFFTPEVVKRLDKVDQQIVAEKQNNDDYREKEKKILENTGLTEETKNKKIEALQNEMFGEEADAFRRRENMRIGLEKMIQENQKKP